MRVEQLFQRVGKKFTAKAAINSCMMATMTSDVKYYDHHKEQFWYNYEEESEEPKPPKERMIGLQTK